MREAALGHRQNLAAANPNNARRRPSRNPPESLKEMPLVFLQILPSQFSLLPQDQSVTIPNLRNCGHMEVKIRPKSDQLWRFAQVRRTKRWPRSIIRPPHYY